MTTSIRCPFCGFEFEAGEGRSTCASCGMHRSCSLTRCPNCGYETPTESKLGNLLKRMWKGRRDVSVERQS